MLLKNHVLGDNLRVLTSNFRVGVVATLAPVKGKLTKTPNVYIQTVDRHTHNSYAIYRESRELCVEFALSPANYLSDVKVYQNYML